MHQDFFEGHFKHKKAAQPFQVLRGMLLIQ
jgi:hypothetical protein